MSDYQPRDEDLRLIDGYLDQNLNEEDMALLESRLSEDPQLVEFFARYSSMVTDLQLASRSRTLVERQLEEMFGDIAISEDQDAGEGESVPGAGMARLKFSKRIWQFAALAATLLASISIGWSLFAAQSSSSVAWIIDAQNCHWIDRDAIRGQFSEGESLEIQSGLVELGFECGASVVVEGPASLQVVSSHRLRLNRGSLAVKMPKGLSGFEVVSANGKVIDLGTEFGVSVDSSGEMNVVVFDGSVQLVAEDPNRELVLNENEQAQLKQDGISQGQSDESTSSFVREIVPPPSFRPVSFSVKFDATDDSLDSFSDSVTDRDGVRTGLYHRLEGTGAALPGNDPNLKMDREKGVLNITATRNDINRQVNLDRSDYLGIPLSQLGFTGDEDFEVVTRISDIPELEDFGQFGLYIGTNSQNCIRGGMIKWGGNRVNHNLFMVGNSGGHDRDSNKVGYIFAGSDIELIFRRIKNRYSLQVKNLTNESSNTLEIRHPHYLDDAQDLQVGLFSATPFRDKHPTIAVEEFTVTVWNQE